MEAVPSLCATALCNGAGGVGYAFGQETNKLDTSTTPGNRRAPIDNYIDVIPSTPSPLPSSASASSSRRLQRRSSPGRPFTSSSDLRGGSRTLGLVPTPNVKMDKKGAPGIIEQSVPAESQHSVRRSSAAELKGSDNNSSWLKRMSTLPSLRSGSFVESPHQASPSLPALHRFDKSTGPVLPAFIEISPGTPPPNKLIKRSSSHRNFKGSNRPHSTLRRPATSHQRSANFQRRSLEDPAPLHKRSSYSSPPYKNLPEDGQSYDDARRSWRPFFRSQSGLSKKGMLSRKHGVSGNTIKDDPSEVAALDTGELPTLLLATSISNESSDDAVQGRSRSLSPSCGPFTPLHIQDPEIVATFDSKAEKARNSESSPRASTSISEIFPSPSPLKWRLPGSGVLRSKKSFARNQGGRRILSAPHSTQALNTTTSYQNPKSLKSRIQISQSESGSTASPGIARGFNDINQKQPPSSLPPLNRLSAFNINLPDSTPSYPNTPLPQELSTSENVIPTNSSPLSTSSIEHVVARNQSHRPSGAPSDHASTLFESDNENSRLMSGDEDDFDGRSDTVYDSTRTGATSNSLKYIKRPPIDTIFDESPPPETHVIENWTPSRPDLVNESDTISGCSENNQDEERGSSTSAQTAGSYEETETIPLSRELRPARAPDKPDPPDSPPAFVSSDLVGQDGLLAGIATDQYDESWSLDTTETLQQNLNAARKTIFSEHVGHFVSSPPELNISRRQGSSLLGKDSSSSKANVFDWSEHPVIDRGSPQGDSPRPKTVHGRQGKETRGSRLSGRRGSSALHLRSQSVPVPTENRISNNSSKIDSWILGNKGPSEDWDGDFDFEEPSRAPKHTSMTDTSRPRLSSGMLVPRAILERQASVHGQFGQVKELTLLVEELIRLQQAATFHGITKGQSAELWKEAEGIINLAIEDDEEQKVLPPHSPKSPLTEFDFSDEESPSQRSRQWSGILASKDEHAPASEDSVSLQTSSRLTHESSKLSTPPPSARPRKESAAKAKTVLEQIHQQRIHYGPALLDPRVTQKKLPFDTTSLKDLVTRAGVVTRALKEEIRRAESKGKAFSLASEQRSSAPPDPAYTQMFTEPPPLPSPGLSRSPRVTSSPKSPSKSPKSQKTSSFVGSSVSSNDNEINGHMKMMTVA